MDYNVVSFSGGRTSAFLVSCMLEKQRNEGWEVEFIFMDTGAEHPKTYEFIRNVVKEWDIDLTCLRLKVNPELGKGNYHNIVDVDGIGNDLVPFSEMAKKYSLPFVGGPFCTSRMKTEIHKKYCDNKYGRGNYTTWLGIRADEPRRLSKKEGIRYLAEISDYEKDDILDWWQEQPFDLEIEEHLGNCTFCIKKSDLKLALAVRDAPEEYEKFIGMTKSPDVRASGGREVTEAMYRKTRTLEQLVCDYSMFTTEEIRNRLRFTKQYDTGSCSESCEVFNTEIGESDD